MEKKRSEAVEQHLKVCDELLQLVREENRILREEKRLPGSSIVSRKEELLLKLGASVEELKGADKASGGGPLLAVARERSLQILRMDRENEQLLLRHSLSSPRPAVAHSLSAAAQLYAARLTDR
jgi:hypothetical protein